MSEVFRIAIVGSGPSGLSAAAHAAAEGISHILLEKTDHLSDTIFRYQKGKHVMATPSLLVLRSDCVFGAGKRETVLTKWNADAEKAGINVRYKSEAKAITGAKGDFSIALTDGAVIKAETVVLAIGTQGNPNLMRCEAATCPTSSTRWTIRRPTSTSTSWCSAAATRASRTHSPDRRPGPGQCPHPVDRNADSPEPRTPTSRC